MLCLAVFRIAGYSQLKTLMYQANKYIVSMKNT